MRPKAIVTFERLFLLSIVLSTIQLALQAGARIGRAGPVTEFVIEAAGILLSVLLVLLASRRRSNVARWLVTVLTLVGLAHTGYDLGHALADGEAVEAVWWVNLIAVALQTVGVAMLFAPEARAWFARRDVASTE